MSLIECPECGKQISDQASSCPNCAYPISQTEAQISTPHVTVEETKKKFKLVSLVASLIIISGIIFVLSGEPIIGAVLCGLSLIALIINSALRWWHHG